MRRTHHAQALYRLIYASQRSPGTNADEFAEAARARNEAAQITSALLCAPDNFAQALEGTRDAVDDTFERIAVDPRHTDVTVLSFAPTERRRFAGHPLLTFVTESDEHRDLFTGLRPDPAKDRPRVTTGSDILRLLDALALVEPAL